MADNDKLINLVASPFEMWARFIEKRDRIAKENFIRWAIEEGKRQGFRLDQSDRAFIHPGDAPKTVHLDVGDPVIVSTAPAVVAGRILYAKASSLPDALRYPPIEVAKSIPGRYKH